MTICPICHGTGIAHRAPYIMRTAQGNLYGITVCACPAGHRTVAEVNRSLAGAKPPGDRP